MSDAGFRGVVIAHAAFADALIGAARRIAGTEEGEDGLVALSNEGLGPDGLGESLDRLLGTAPGVIFADLHVGSCGMAARRACLHRNDRLLVTGANLPMLLEFIMNRDLPLDELAQRLVERGRAAIGSFQDTDDG